ncbi:beta-ketoacyl synthase chain length factor [Methylohalobius crimeensis]|uniref:beta-ketoacyl synthase chain length factor n=1 Tax=Methylohalobius crimeensis TaxID=244365 RepID=UPI0003B4A55A|nr:beta-ketoacyl synthase chain length factor [Methylohalobius crimeensis]
MIKFQVKCWRAWLPPELRPDPVASKVGALLPGDAPDVSFLPLMQRRRLSPMARAAVAAAWPCLAKEVEIPVICCSLHGETRHCFGILSALAEADEVSPSQFALSVHSAVGGLLTQLIGSQAPCLVIAPGSEGYAAALLDAAGFLLFQEGGGGEGMSASQEVLVLWHEQPLPAVYHPYAPDPPGVMALAVRLGAWRGQGTALTVDRVPGKGTDRSAEKSPLVRVIEGFSAGVDRWISAAEGAQWHWELEHV